MNDTARPRRTGLVSASIVMGFSFILATVIAGGFLLETKASSKTIRVKGYAEKKITSDFAVWRGTVTARGTPLADVYGALEKSMGSVAGLLDRKGVPRERTALSSIATEVRYRKNDKGAETSEIEAYNLTQSITVNLNDVNMADALAKESNQLIKEGIEFTSGAPEFYFTGLERLKIDMLGEATADAKRRAEKIASSGGITIGKLRSAEQGVFQITPVLSTEVSGYGVLDTTSIEKAIKAVVDAEFGVK